MRFTCNSIAIRLPHAINDSPLQPVTMARCQDCRSVTYRAIKGRMPDPNLKSQASASGPCSSPIRTWPSFESLTRSAQSGCDLCALLHDALSRLICNLAISHKPECLELRLGSSGQYLALDAGMFIETAIIPIEEGVNGDDATRARNRDLPSATIPRSSGTVDGPAICRAWIEKCRDTHEDCRRSVTSRRLVNLPKRLIDVATHDTKVLVLDCQAWIAAGLASRRRLQRYCTLSYSWGAQSHTCVLRQPFPQTLQVPIKNMPRTFHDAISVTKRLGLRYLWIDALCIVQGDERELAEEVLNMGNIYWNARVTIAATGANNVHEGFLNGWFDDFHDLHPCILENSRRGLPTQYFTVRPSRLDFESCVPNAPLNRRGWVTQERALSRRILHFTPQGMFWECGTVKADWRNPKGLSTLTYGIGGLLTCSPRREGLLSICRIGQSRHFCNAEWRHFIRRYSQTEFTDLGDRLLAISAVAQAVSPYLNAGAYLAGTWRKTLEVDLLWKCSQSKFKWRSEFEAVAPTWSWASVVGLVEFMDEGIRLVRHSGFSEIIAAAVMPQFPQNPYGSVALGWVKIKGTLKQQLLPTSRLGDFADISVGYTVWWDERQTEGWEWCCHYKQATLLSLCSLTTASASKMTIGGLVLKPTSFKKTYRRIGWFEQEISKSWYCDFVRLRHHELFEQQEELSEKDRVKMSLWWMQSWRMINWDPEEILII
jgi:hypothetical protein